jgi:hypothetical protein
MLVGGSAAAAQGYSPTPVSVQGVMALPAATSTALVSASVTLSPNSAALPAAGAFTWLTIKAPASGCVFTVNWLGGTATATSGEQFTAGQVETVNLVGRSAAPTLYSASGCASPNLVQFHN